MPLRPVFGVLMVLFLGAGFYLMYVRNGRRVTGSASLDDEMAAQPGRRLFWAAAILSIALWALPIVLTMVSGAESHP